MLLDDRSALSVGFCLAHMVTDKRGWLERLAVDALWPMAGKTVEIYLVQSVPDATARADATFHLAPPCRGRRA